MTYKEDYYDEYARHDTSNEGAILSGCLQGVISIILVVLIVLLCCMLSACRTQKEIVADTRHTTDTVYALKTQRDSLVMKDSVHVTEKGDTVMIDRWHTRYVMRQTHDTLYKATHDTIPAPYPVIKEVEKNLTWWQKTRMHIGEAAMGFCGMALLAVVVYVFVRRKFPLV